MLDYMLCHMYATLDPFSSLTVRGNLHSSRAFTWLSGQKLVEKHQSQKSRRRVLLTYFLIELSRIFNKPKMMYCQKMCTYQYSRVERYSKSSTPRPEVEHPESPDGKCWQIHAWQPKQDFELHFPPGLWSYGCTCGDRKIQFLSAVSTRKRALSSRCHLQSFQQIGFKKANEELSIMYIHSTFLSFPKMQLVKSELWPCQMVVTRDMVVWLLQKCIARSDGLHRKACSKLTIIITAEKSSQQVPQGFKCHFSLCTLLCVALLHSYFSRRSNEKPASFMLKMHFWLMRIETFIRTT